MDYESNLDSCLVVSILSLYDVSMITHEQNIEMREMKGEGLQGVTKQIAVGPRDGWQDGYMRIFTLAKGGHTAAHSHPWWHVNYILEGEGMLYLDGVGHAVKRGSVA